MYKVIGTDQKIYGPVSVAQIRQWQAEGRINGVSLLQAEGSTDWKPLSSLPEFGIGVPPTVSMPPSTKAARDNMAVAGLTFGLLSNLCCSGGICAVLGIVFSVIALNRHEANPQQGSKGMAVVGLILSVVGFSWHWLLPFHVGLPFSPWIRLHHFWRPW